MLPEGFPTRKADVNAALANRGLRAGTNVHDNQWMLLDALTHFSWPTSAPQQTSAAQQETFKKQKVNTGEAKYTAELVLSMAARLVSGDLPAANLTRYDKPALRKAVTDGTITDAAQVAAVKQIKSAAELEQIENAEKYWSQVPDAQKHAVASKIDGFADKTLVEQVQLFKAHDNEIFEQWKAGSLCDVEQRLASPQQVADRKQRFEEQRKKATAASARLGNPNITPPEALQEGGSASGNVYQVFVDFNGPLADVSELTAKYRTYGELFERNQDTVGKAEKEKLLDKAAADSSSRFVCSVGSPLWRIFGPRR